MSGGSPAALAGIVVVAALTAGALVVPRPRARAGVLLAATLLAPVLLVGHIWDSGPLVTLRGDLGLAAVALVVGVTVIGALAWLLLRRPGLVAPLAVAALPFRVPITAGDDAANLLVPLYLVVGAGVIAAVAPVLVPALARRLAPRDSSAGEDLAAGAAAIMPRRVDAIAWVLAASVALFAVAALYSTDLDQALDQLVFFYVPFAALFALLVRLDWTPRLLLTCFGVAVALALALVAIGYFEYATQSLLLNPRVSRSNQLNDYFRVNSLFFDPNIYGRFLAVVMLLVAGALLWIRSRRFALGAAAVLAVLWGGLLLSFSQSSLVALLVGLAVLAGLRWGARLSLALAAVVVLAGVVVVVAAPGAVGLGGEGDRDLNSATSGRFGLVSGGVDLALERPLVGYGAGAFALEYRRARKSSRQQTASASHTTPITIAAEQGVIGLAAYLALLVIAAVTLFGRGVRRSPARAAIAAVFVALVVHTLLYASFLEDPLTWAILAIGSALAARARDPAGADLTAGAEAPSSAAARTEAAPA